jgi:ketosteroid isomerase-like protein
VKEQENTETVKLMYAAFGRGDKATLMEGFADDVEWEIAGPAAIPICGSRHGREQVAQFFTVLAETLEPQQFEPRQFIAQDDLVVVLGHERQRAKATGRSYEGEWAQVFTLRDGKVVKYREYFDTAAALAAFRL